MLDHTSAVVIFLFTPSGGCFTWNSDLCCTELQQRYKWTVPCMSARRMCDFYNLHSVESYKYKASLNCSLSSHAAQWVSIWVPLVTVLHVVWHAFDLKLGSNIIMLTERLLEGTVILFALCLLLLLSSSWLLPTPMSTRSVSSLSVTAATHLHISGAFWEKARRGKRKISRPPKIEKKKHMHECI